MPGNLYMSDQISLVIQMQVQARCELMKVSGGHVKTIPKHGGHLTYGLSQSPCVYVLPCLSKLGRISEE